MSKNASTGLRTESGKAISSRNSLKHGLASSTIFISGERAADLAALEQSLIDQYQPADPTETILVRDMARHHWLKERALRLQDRAVEDAYPGELPPSFALLLRYQTTHERAFHKALTTLLALRKEQVSAQVRKDKFVSQQKLKADQRQIDAINAYIYSPMPGASSQAFADDLEQVARLGALHGPNRAHHTAGI